MPGWGQRWSAERILLPQGTEAVHRGRGPGGLLPRVMTKGRLLKQRQPGSPCMVRWQHRSELGADALRVPLISLRTHSAPWRANAKRAGSRDESHRVQRLLLL